MAYVKCLPVSSGSHLMNLLDYVNNPDKTIVNNLITCNDCLLETAYNDFMDVKKMHGQTGGILAHQMIQSFEPGEIQDYETAHKIGCELAVQLLPNYQYTVVTHVDREHIHNHIILNSVNFETGDKYWGNKTSLALAQKASDNLCQKYGLSVIGERSGLKGIDRATIETARKGKSWKVQLCSDLDDVLATCKTKQDFIRLLNERGYDVKYMNVHITFQKRGEPKGIRADTLARQFGAQYTKTNIEKKIADRPLEAMKTPQPAKPDESKSEWQRYERRVFETRKARPTGQIFQKPAKQVSPEVRAMLYLKGSALYAHRGTDFLIRSALFLFKWANPKNRAEYVSLRRWVNQKKEQPQKYTGQQEKQLERKFGNVSYERLIKTYGDVTTLKIPPEKLREFAALNIFFCGKVKENGDVYVSFKKINEPAVSRALGFDIGDIKTKSELRDERFARAAIRAEVEKTGRQLYSLDCDYDGLKALEANNVTFSYTRRQGTRYSVTFFSDELHRVAGLLGKDVNHELEAYSIKINNRRYGELKQAEKNGEKVIFRVVDEKGLAKLKNSDLVFASFKKDAKYNIALLECDMRKYDRALSTGRKTAGQTQPDADDTPGTGGGAHRAR